MLKTNNGGKALVLGASSGIGRELALLLARNGWQVCATGRRGELLGQLQGEFPQKIVTHAFDVDDLPNLLPNLNVCLEKLGGMDLLVVSAGTGFLNPGLDFSVEVPTLSTNVFAFTGAIDWGFGHFLKNPGGQIAAITSVGGLVSEQAAPAYSASKAYQVMYLDAIDKKAKKNNSCCTVTELRPGPVKTAMMKGEGHFWVCSAQRAAELSYRAIVRKKRLQYISRRWLAIGILLRLFSLFS
jgi:Short-chain dehydrogenases of various substrate specificities